MTTTVRFLFGIRTNSRGEAVLRLRGSEERQTGVYLDGASQLGLPQPDRTTALGVASLDPRAGRCL